jgi:NADH dehydrogenase
VSPAFATEGEAALDLEHGTGQLGGLPESGVSEHLVAGTASESHHIVIVGAGFGGLAAARVLGNGPVRVTLVDRRNYHLFQPLLYQVATSVLSPSDIAEPIRRILSRYKNITVLMGEVTGIDTERREIQFAGRVLRYDTLVLATGATHSYFGHSEWERFAPGLKTLEDARRIRTDILLALERAELETDPEVRRRLMTFAVIGGGPTGVEMAGSIAGLTHEALEREFRNIDPRRSRILLVEAGSRILPQFPEDLSAYAARALVRLGVEISVGAPVNDINVDGIQVGETFIPCGTVVWGAGVRASPVGDWLSRETDRAGHVSVNPDLSVPGFENIYIIGDAALARDEKGKPLPGLAQVAHQQGYYLGRALLRRITRGEEPPPFRFHSRGNLAVIGRNAAVVEWNDVKLRGFVAWLVWGIAHVYLLVGFQNRLIVTLRWLYAYLTYRPGTRIIPDDRGGEVMAQPKEPRGM